MTEQQHGQITAEQYTTLMTPIRGARISSRKQGGKELSYVEAWDIKAHLTRIFGFGNWDSEMLDYAYITTREYKSSGDNPKAMIEVIYSARVQLTVRDQWGNHLCRHSEAACGNASGPASQPGDLHDNALKTAASDALKRCAINLGSQFGLSLYNNGSRAEVIRKTIVTPEGWAAPDVPAQAKANLEKSVGASDHPATDPIGDASEVGHENDYSLDSDHPDRDHPDAIAGDPNEHGSH